MYFLYSENLFVNVIEMFDYNLDLIWFKHTFCILIYCDFCLNIVTMGLKHWKEFEFEANREWILINI